jgi:hypothetical protein
MKVPLGGGAYLEPDENPRDTRWHKKIISMRPILGTRTGHRVVLECGHVCQTFGRLDHAQGVILCTECRDKEER